MILYFNIIKIINILLSFFLIKILANESIPLNLDNRSNDVIDNSNYTNIEAGYLAIDQYLLGLIGISPYVAKVNIPTDIKNKRYLRSKKKK